MRAVLAARRLGGCFGQQRFGHGLDRGFDLAEQRVPDHGAVIEFVRVESITNRADEPLSEIQRHIVVDHLRIERMKRRGHLDCRKRPARAGLVDRDGGAPRGVEHLAHHLLELLDLRLECLCFRRGLYRTRSGFDLDHFDNLGFGFVQFRFELVERGFGIAWCWLFDEGGHRKFEHRQVAVRQEFGMRGFIRFNHCCRRGFLFKHWFNSRLVHWVGNPFWCLLGRLGKPCLDCPEGHGLEALIFDRFGFD